MPVPNPDPTHLTAVLTVRDKDDVSLGSATVSVDAWELVIEANLPAVTLALPAGTFKIDSAIGMLCPEEPIIQPQAAFEESTPTLVGAGGNTNSSPVYNEGHRSIDGNDVEVLFRVAVARQVGAEWRFFGEGTARVAVPAQTVSVAEDFQVMSQHQILSPGAENDFIIDPSMYEKHLIHFAEAGVDWVRFSAPWFYMEEISGTLFEPHATKLDGVFTAIRALGLKATVIVAPGTPCWASTHAGKNCASRTSRPGTNNLTILADPTDWALYEDYVRRFVNRYQPDIVETSNEPNAAVANRTPAQHMTYATRCWNGVKASDHPNTPVAGPVLAFADTAYLQGCYDAGFKAVTDMVSIHPYNFPHIVPAEGPWIFKQQDPRVPMPANGQLSDLEATLVQGTHRIHKVMRDNDDGDKPIIISEWGYTTSSTFIRSVAQNRKGVWLREGMRLSARMPYLQVAGLYTLVSPGGAPTSSGTGFGSVLRAGYRQQSFYDLQTALAEIRAGTD